MRPSIIRLSIKNIWIIIPKKRLISGIVMCGHYTVWLCQTLELLGQSQHKGASSGVVGAVEPIGDCDGVGIVEEIEDIYCNFEVSGGTKANGDIAREMTREAAVVVWAGA